MTLWRNIATAVGGTAAAQLIPVAGSLLLARLFQPDEFGEFSAWLGLVLLLSVIMTGRFETALAIESDGAPRRKAVMSVLLTVLVSGAACLVGLGAVLVLRPSILGDQPVGLWMALVPAAALLAVAQIWQAWAAAEGRYRPLVLMRVVQAASVTLLQCLAGLLWSSSEALSLAYLGGVGLGVIFCMIVLPPGALPNWQGLLAFWSSRRRFPLYSLPADAVNTGAVQLPVLIIASRFGADVAGLLAMTLRTLGAPIGLIGTAVLDVFKRHAASAFRARGHCRPEYLQTLKLLAVASAVISAVLIFSSEWLFAHLFGPQWRAAGTMAIWLMPLFGFRLIASPLSYLVYIVGRQHLDLLWQIALLGMTLLSLNLASGYDSALKLYSLGYSLLYVAYLGMSYRFSRGVSGSE